MKYNNRDLKIIAVDVFLEKRKTRVYVGRLTFEKDAYKFVYEKSYLYAKASIPLGNEFPLTQQEYVSGTLFPSLSDRVPVRENPAYSDYCENAGISETEENPLVLLPTIGRRGPSSFIFEPVYDRGFGGKKCRKFRTELGLTIREFANVFDLAQTTVIAIEKGKHSGKEVLKRIEIYYLYPNVALNEIHIRGGFLHESKKMKVLQILLKKEAE
ncbi:MAG: HipA N-terminal domain-containing protein [Candidatus Omnitrophica bacterium]|nr:HipA N-terminal domain-containing protein [Candidatus Omnitrophota bacterium]